MTATSQNENRPPVARGGLPGLGHLLKLRADPIELMQRVHRQCGELGEIRLARQPVVMMYGEQAQEAFFRAPDDQLDQPSAYPFMTPIFGEGVVFDADPEQRRQAMKNQSLRDKFMRGHAEVIAEETERMIAGWGQSGEIDLLDFFAELTIYTSSACLLGREFRAELTSEFAVAFRGLEGGTDALAYVNPYLPLPTFRRRDRARLRLVELITQIIDRREAEGRKPQDLVYILTRLKNEDGTPRYTPNVITGMFISMMFAGHHTTSGTAAWSLIELLRNPDVKERVTNELDDLFADGRAVSFHALREIPELECAIKEALRLHPPLILLMRKVMHAFHYKGWTIPAGTTVAVSPAVSNRMPEHFPDPDLYHPDRYKPGREEDKRSFAWIPFGGGRHRCVGAAFAMMQLKAIFSVLLRRYEFEMAQPSDSYRNDNSKMVIQLEHPCRVRYRRRDAFAASAKHAEARDQSPTAPIAVEVDHDLCQGHGVCVGEAPFMFELVKETNKVRILAREASDADRAAVEAAIEHCPTHALRRGGPVSKGLSEQPSRRQPKE
ncbi:MAG: cytochrome P450 [Myxococcota bacterium]|nr:cytochrome P450 [Myxococcota bacterium]